jgi:hypothetical protein
MGEGNRARALVALAVAALALTAGRAGAQQADPNFAAVKRVCGRCHSELPFMGQVRTWPRWNDVFRQMSRLGATGTQDELEQVTAYFLDHLTTLNVNSASADELAWVLDVDDAVAEDIVRRRAARRFENAEQLAAVPGVRSERLQLLRERVEF